MTPEIARGLSQVVSQALGDDAPAATLEAARQLAQLLGLPGLERLLGTLATHAAGAWPPALRPVVEHVRRAAGACGREGSVEPLRRVDDELGLVARAIERVPMAQGPAAPAAASEGHGPRRAAESAPVPLAEVLAGLRVQRANEDLLQRMRLHPSVGGALRAALDWLLGEGEPHLRLWLATDGSALEVTCEGIVFSNVHAASEVLASVGAHLGPAGERPGAWTVRVPTLAERDTFLMVEQDELQLAIPWHAVARVRLMPADTIDTMARRQGLPVLAPLAVAPRRSAEQPVVVVALGLKRACLVADRLVWRMPAQPADPPEAPPAAGIVRAVRSDDGDLYWVLDPAWLLRDVAAPALAGPSPARPPATTVPAREPAAPPPPIPFPIAARRAEPAEASEPTEPADPAEPAGSAAPPWPQPHESEPIPALGPRDVEPLEPPTPEAASPSAPVANVPGETAPISAPSGRPAPAVAQALVAEDSITARIFLVRLLEQRGLAVHAVGTAAELRTLMPHGPWALVCADIELPDARGDAFLAEMTQRAAASRSPLVALVRDAADEAVAHAAGAVATLRKPYEREALDRLLARLVPGLPARPAPGGSDPREWGAR
jgi:CheY-like chemotaxis protein